MSLGVGEREVHSAASEIHIAQCEFIQFQITGALQVLAVLRHIEPQVGMGLQPVQCHHAVCQSGAGS